MKTKFAWMLLVFAIAAQAASFDAATPRPPQIQPLQQQARAAHLTAELLGHYHYKTVALDNALSEKIFDRYLKALDGEKLFFIQADIDRWANARTKLDDAIVGEDLSIPFAVFNLYTQRLVERFAYARSLLKTGFDFGQNESYQYVREKGPWAKTEEEARELWRKRVKNDWLHLKLAGKNDAAIVETLDRRYENFIKRIDRTKSEDAFQIFMNAYTMAVEPHTNYMGPRASEDFDISMKLSLVGIGAVLEEKNEYTTIRELVPGGPAALSGKLKVGDRIVGVGQAETGAVTDVLGWRLDDTVALIRGAIDSVVVLDVLPAGAGVDGKHESVSLVRKKISLEQQAAKKSILSVNSGDAARRIGVISLPGFYQDFDARQRGEPDFKSATRDVARLLGELKQEQVDSVLIDLRNNGGGSLSEAIELTGLFIDAGPVVQQRDAKGRISIDGDTNAGVAWDGPLGVLINRGSASASEIFAAAIQDYRRGVVIGEPSFGKGTVQTLINLDEVARNETPDKPKFGELKLTIAQFFRINGGTTQQRGVTPDILLPAVSDTESFGESAYDNALPWTRIRAASYEAAGDLKDVLPELQVRHRSRVRNDKDFLYFEEDLAELNVLRKKTTVSLNEAERRKERDAQEARLKSRDGRNGAGEGGGTTPTEKREAPREEAPQAAEEPEDVPVLAKLGEGGKDVLLSEAANILGDDVDLRKARSAARIAAGGQERGVAGIGVR